MHGRDNKLRVQKAAFRSPNTVALMERFIQTLQQGCLDYFVVFGERHMNHLVREMVAYYRESRPARCDRICREPVLSHLAFKE
jgi:hypothetical protein